MSVAAKTILVVEDNAGIRDSLVDILREEGYAAEGASDGTEAVRQLESLRPALVLLDLMIPGINGQELHAYMRGDPRLSSIPVVVLTANPRGPEYFGMDTAEWLRKPFTLDQLLEAVERHMPAPSR